MVPRHDQHLVTGAPRLLDLEAVIRAKGAKPVSKPSADGPSPVEDAGIWRGTATYDEHDVFVEGSHDRGPVTSIRGLKLSEHDVYVLLRHACRLRAA
jgi:hypothetical protein